MPELLGRLQSALADRYRLDREVGAGGMATVYLAAGRPPRPAGRAQGAPARARGRHRRRALPRRDQAHGQPAAPAHPAAVRLGRGRRLPVLRHAVHRGRVAARPAQPREAAARARRGADRHRSRRGARLRAPPRRGASRHQAREHPAARRPGAGGRLRHRARPPARPSGVAHDRDRHVASARRTTCRPSRRWASARSPPARTSTRSAPCCTRCSPASRRSPAPPRRRSSRGW